MVYLIKPLRMLGFLALFFGQIAGAASDQGTLFFAPLPVENAKISMAKSLRLTQFLSQTLGRPVEPRFYESYEEILQDLERGQLDFAELGAFGFYKLNEKPTVLKPLVFIRQYEEQEAYHCVLASAVDGVGKVSELTSLPDARVLLTQPLSTCGWFSSEYLFRQAGLNLNQYSHQHVGSHENVALGLLRKEALVGSLADFIAARYEGLGLNVLAITPPLPFFTLVGHPVRVGEKNLERLADELIKLSPEQTYGWGLGQFGFLPYDVELHLNYKDMVGTMQPDLGNKYD